MHHLDQAGFNVNAAMTCVLPMAQTVYTGDEDGRVVSYLRRSKDNDSVTNCFSSTSGIAFNGMMSAEIEVMLEGSDFGVHISLINIS